MTGTSEDEAYNELQCYTLELGDPAFVHQHVVDAWAAQHADAALKPIGLTFALVGLYLHLERGFSGRQVQRTHMALARHDRAWPSFVLPDDRGEVTVKEVMDCRAGPQRHEAIDAWCASVWTAYRESHQVVVELLKEHGIE